MPPAAKSKSAPAPAPSAPALAPTRSGSVLGTRISFLDREQPINEFAQRQVKKRHRFLATDSGVWSPAGKAFLPHGTPHLRLGRKPTELAELDDEIEEAAAAPAPAANVHSRPYRESIRRARLALANWPEPDPKKMFGYECKARESIRHFPRDMLKSSEELMRVIESGHSSMAQLSRCARTRRPARPGARETHITPHGRATGRTVHMPRRELLQFPSLLPEAAPLAPSAAPALTSCALGSPPIHPPPRAFLPLPL